MLSGVLGNRKRLSCESRCTLMTPSRMRRLTQEVETCRHCATLAMVSHPEMWRSRIDLASCSTRCRCRMTRTVLAGTWLHRGERCPSCVSIAAIAASSMPCRASSSRRVCISAPRESADTACTRGSTSSWEISPPRQTTRIMIRSRVTRCRITLSIRERSRAFLLSRLTCGRCQISGSRAPRARKSFCSSALSASGLHASA